MPNFLVQVVFPTTQSIIIKNEGGVSGIQTQSGFFKGEKKFSEIGLKPPPTPGDPIFVFESHTTVFMVDIGLTYYTSINHNYSPSAKSKGCSDF